MVDGMIIGICNDTPDKNCRTRIMLAFPPVSSMKEPITNDPHSDHFCQP